MRCLRRLVWSMHRPRRTDVLVVSSLIVTALRGQWRASHTHTTFQPIVRLLLADGVPFMSDDAASANLQDVLEKRSERVRKPKSTVLFRLGERPLACLSFSAAK